MFFFVAVPVIGGILSKVLGRKLGSLVTAGGAGAAAWIFSASLLIAGVAALLTMLVVGILGVGAMQRGIGRGLLGGIHLRDVVRDPLAVAGHDGLPRL